MCTSYNGIIFTAMLILVTSSSLQACPTWFTQCPNSTACVCGQQFNSENFKLVDCNQFLNKTMLLPGYCMTHNESDDNEYIGICPYNTKSSSFNYSVVPSDVSKLNEEMCGPLNRTGLLCSECQDGLGPAVFSFTRECKECLEYPYGWILFFVRLTVPLTLFCILVIVFEIDVASPSLNGFVIVAQFTSCAICRNPFLVSGLTDSYSIVKFAADCYSLFNLDILLFLIPSFCISEDLEMLHVLALEYTVALYPILFTIAAYLVILLHYKGCKVVVFCWKPFRRCFIKFRKSWELKGSVISAFATFLHLSCCKLSVISVFLLQEVPVMDKKGGIIYRLYYGTDFAFYGITYKILAGISVVLLVIMVVLPALFLLLYQFPLFQRCLQMCRIRCVLLHELANITQGSFKNGTSPGTRDYRWFAGLYLILRLILIYFITQPYNLFILLSLCTPMAMLVIVLRPYKEDRYNKLDAIFWLLPVFIISSHMYILARYGPDHWNGVLYAAVSVPLIYLVCLILWRVFMSAFKWCRLYCFEAIRLRIFNRTKMDDKEDSFPHRIISPNEYTPLILHASNK